MAGDEGTDFRSSVFRIAAVNACDRRALDIIIPFHGNEEFILFKSLQDIHTELNQLAATIVLIHDSAQDTALQQTLSAAQGALSAVVPCRLIESQRNTGFGRRVNTALEQAVAARHDALMLHSGTVVFPGALLEMRKVAECDPMIGFVSPRSNDGGICTFARQREVQPAEAAESFAAFQQLCARVPEFHFVPAAEGFCLWIKLEVLEEFGVFDESYVNDGWPEKDLMMRANRCGYRAALANHAFVYHAGTCGCADSSASKPIQDRDAAILNQRYAEYAPSVAKYTDGENSQAERLLGALAPDREGHLDLVFDFSSLDLYHNGTSEVSKEILRRATTMWPQFKLYVLASEKAVRFHQLENLEGVTFVAPDVKRKFALAFRVGQPFSCEQLYRMNMLAALNVYCMLDPIAFDCLYLKNPGLETIWSAVFAWADGVIYISDFAKEQFGRRFRKRPGLAELVAHPSLDYRDYLPEPAENRDGDYILVIGNTFAHKRVPATVAALSRAFPDQKIVALGVSGQPGANIISYESGNLSEKEMDRVWREARFVVFPSAYEGFGIPVVKSLAYRKPILARSIPATREIKEKLQGQDNLILYGCTSELIRKLRQGFPAWKTGHGIRGDPQAGWDAMTEKIGRFLDEVSRSVSYADLLLPRLQHLQLLRASCEESEATARLEDLYKSWSWRLTAPLRRLAHIYIRSGRRAS